MNRFIFAKAIRALAVGGEVSNARAYATNAYGAASPATQWLATKAAVLATGDIDDPDDIGLSGIGDFVSLVQRENLITKIRDALGGGFREMVPFRAVTLETDIAGASWTAEAALKVIDSNTSFSLQRFGVRKCTAVTIATAELVRFVNERSDAVLENALARAVGREISRTFAGNSASSDASPGGIFHGVEAVASSGDIEADVTGLLDGFAGDLSSSCFIMPPALAARLNLLGHDTISATGGTLAGTVAVTSDAIPAGVIGLIDARAVLLYEGPLVPDVTGQAAITVDDGSGPKILATWQNNLYALRAEQYINWALPDPDHARWASGVAAISRNDAPTTKRKGQTS
ncbi:phage major capsid protein [Paraburkholderia sprentiae WSM5005]|uniref:Phage major capsid protein n=1 Tax=Paraburkholderia sprentiae WSM5005 TaxID=754502 RepID=A0A1I9YDF2_9BURK|nr:phage major capsid protein [Paraburkholderia sprentiae]APA84335.1 phage major capsid protein [Paraburkholderia sprentiae WSM5005]